MDSSGVGVALAAHIALLETIYSKYAAMDPASGYETLLMADKYWAEVVNAAKGLK